MKGVQTLADAKRLTAVGVDAIVLSNHGGRQLDRAPVPFHLLPTVAKEVGIDIEVHLDTGIMSGADIVAAIALGAAFTLIGRAYPTASSHADGAATWVPPYRHVDSVVSAAVSGGPRLEFGTPRDNRASFGRFGRNLNLPGP